MTEGAGTSPLQLPGSSLEASGFLDKDYGRFTSVAGARHLALGEPGVNWRQYTKARRAGRGVINPQAEYGGIQPDNLQADGPTNSARW